MWLSVVRQCSYRQGYTSSQWSKCCGLTKLHVNETTSGTPSVISLILVTSFPTFFAVVIETMHSRLQAGDKKVQELVTEKLLVKPQ